MVDAEAGGGSNRLFNCPDVHLKSPDFGEATTQIKDLKKAVWSSRGDAVGVLRRLPSALKGGSNRLF